MSKLEALNDDSMTPEWILHHVLEGIEEVKSIAVMILDKDDKVSVAYSHQPAEQLYSLFVKFQAVIVQHALGDAPEQQP